MSFQPVAMAEASRAGAVRLCRRLPDEIVIWEIFVRLPPMSLLRCRAVCRAWRRATSTRDFLLAHHDRQPALPLLYEHNFNGGIGTIPSIDIISLDHRAGVAAADKLHSVALLGKGDTYMEPKASCDGLVILTIATDSSISDVWQFTVCNPATRQYAPLPLLRGFNLAGMYRHPPTCEYRLLLYPDAMLGDDDRPPDVQDACYVYALGSCQPPRHIGWPEVEVVIHAIVPAFFLGCLHWFLEQDQFDSSKIMVFDTVAELFRQMRAPAIPGAADLFEMDGMLGMASFPEEVTTIDIWTIQDYDSEIWGLSLLVSLFVLFCNTASTALAYAAAVTLYYHHT